MEKVFEIEAVIAKLIIANIKTSAMLEVDQRVMSMLAMLTASDANGGNDDCDDTAYVPI